MQPLPKIFLSRNPGAYRRLMLILAVCLVVVESADAATQGEKPTTQKDVLLIYDARRESLGNITVDRTMRRVLFEEFGVNVDIRSEYFEPTTTPQRDYPIFLSWLRRKYAEKHFDVIIPVGATAAQFL